MLGFVVHTTFLENPFLAMDVFVQPETECVQRSWSRKDIGGPCKELTQSRHLFLRRD